MPAAQPRPVRYAQIGTGHAHASKLSVYLKSPEYEVVGLAEPDPELQDRARQGIYADVPLMSVEQLLNIPGLQVVGVETEVRDLLPTAEKCIQAGKHIHLDKPAGESLPHYRRIMELASSRKLAVQMGYMYRYSPAVVLMRKFLDAGWLGEPFEVHTVMSKVVPTGGRRSLAEYPGGIMFELGCHIIDLVIGVLGRPENITAFHRQSGPQQDSLRDNMLAVFEYPEALATVRSTALEVEGFARRHFTVCGTEGTLHIQPLDRPAVRVAFSRGRGKYRKGYQTIEFGSYPRYVGDAAELAAVARGERELSFTPEHDLNVQEAVLLASGLPVEGEMP
ncbi:MAG: Gfo/Idh/MocA family oxidoreductase [Planctomycetaceae bacterium]|nr:Gfo/Idh/MocA family oxidoreductase [Planctomycetaceae bacterium]